ncbi:PQQ-dependent sugar dehydrogenase [Rubritalea marina]|uniref:PQQ-dependent sugar dehydrogenase n=1 Tax=Rubritalea marina TaxID=361055 RepID=UPI00037EA76D|nr:PQQ-dependent sugar dehydrogenase [Rubritalea marina]
MIKSYVLTCATLLGSLPLLQAFPLEIQRVADGLDKPVEVRGHAGMPQLVYIVEKTGKIKIYDSKLGKVLQTPFLDIKDRVRSSASEQGLLSIAFPGDFSSSKRFYVYYTKQDDSSVLSRFSVNDAYQAIAESEEVLLTHPQDYRNHNGGSLRFGPDHMLYISLGDGGAANDPKRRAQDLESLLGKLLRIDVSPATGYQIPKDNPYVDDQHARPEILSYGLRNPWRICWDGDTLYIADVGQNKYEEINATTHRALFAANFGWPQWEAFEKTNNRKPKKINSGTLIKPIYAYKHGTNDFQGLSISGAAIAPPNYPKLDGRFLFADYVTHYVWSGSLSNGKLDGVRQHELLIDGKAIKVEQIASVDRAANQKLYFTSILGEVYEVKQ